MSIFLLEERRSSFTFRFHLMPALLGCSVMVMLPLPPGSGIAATTRQVFS